MEAGHIATTARERGQGIGGSEILQIERDFAFLTHHLGNFRDGVTEARMDAQSGIALSEGALDLEVELGGDVLQLRRQPRPRSSLRPQELLAEWGQPRAAALLQVHQRTAKKLRPFPDRVPGVAIRYTGAG